MTVHINESSIYNILSFAEVSNIVGVHIKMDMYKGKLINVHIKDGKSFISKYVNVVFSKATLMILPWSLILLMFHLMPTIIYRFITFIQGYLVCVDLLTFVWSSHFYKKIAFVSSTFYQNHQVSNRRAYLWSEDHIHRSTEELQQEEYIHVSP